MVLGRNLTRADGAAKVSGSATYTADVLEPAALWAGFVRSPYPHARIVGIDASKAKALPGVRVIISANDIPARLMAFHSLKDKPALAIDVVRYVGERVVGIAATDKNTLERAIQMVDVEYDELPAVFDPLEAMASGAPVIHPKYFEYRSTFEVEDKDSFDMNRPSFRTSSVPVSIMPSRPGIVYGPRNMDPSTKNVQSIWLIKKGDIEKGFEEADYILEGTATTPIISQGYMEPGAVVVKIDDGGTVHVWAAHQSRFQVRAGMADFIEIPEGRILVHPVNVGGSFGGKMIFEQAVCAYYLAKAAGEPVKIIESYQDVLVDGAPRHASITRVRAGVKKDGQLCAWHGQVYYAGGAYTGRTPGNATMNGTLRLAGSYRTPNVLIESYVAYTNHVPGGYFRGPGEIQCLFPVESLVDDVAKALDMDPLEFRLKNAVREGDTFPTDEPVEDPRGVEVLNEMKRIANSETFKLQPPTDAHHLAVGRGVAFGHRHIGGGQTNMRLRLTPDGSLVLVTSVADTGTGTHTMQRQVVAAVLGVNPELVQIEETGTEGPFDTGIRASRGTHVEGQAAAATSRAFMDLAVRTAAAYWDMPEEQVEWRDGQLMNVNTEGKLTLTDLAGLSVSNPIEAEGGYGGPQSTIFDFQGIIADVAVDIETGEVQVLHLYFTHDSTLVINPILHDGQLYGSIIQGIGHTLMEELVLESGVVTNPHLADYKIPNIYDIPPVVLTHVKAAVGPGPFNTKGVSELGIGVVAPAVANAIRNATGARVKRLPLTSEHVLQALREERRPTT